MTEPSNRRIVLAARPQGLPALQDFRLEHAPMPTPREGEVLLRTLYLSLDPYMRQMMDEVPPLYADAPLDLGQPMPGGTVSRVVASRHPGFAVGELVLARSGWQDYAVSNGGDLIRLGDMSQPSLALGGLGMPAFTAYVGLLDVGRPLPGDTVVVAAATGGVGAVVGQIAKLKGARVVGIAGGQAKCRHAVDVLGFDACIDRHDPDLAERLAAACPDGIDVYFENVGGPVFDAVLPLLKIGARVPVIGTIAHYNDAAPRPGPDRLPALMTAVLQKRLLVQGVVILDHYADRHDAFQRDITAWVADGRIRVQEDRVDGLEHAPAAFIEMLQGHHLGKRVVQVDR